jgi:2-keto-4-pentenoate hydratase/2-oxohepta-3-ene-1,7-dioic acid hydratase in catechol pathway
VKIVRYRSGDEVFWGRLDDGGEIARLAGPPFEGVQLDGRRDRRDMVELLAPVDRPQVFGVGLNYVSHIAETGQKAPEFPMLFMKPWSSVIGPEAPIVYPRQGREVHYEGELAVVLGRAARRVPESRALDHVFGYTCANDVSERPIQFAEMAMGCLLIGKGFDSFCPLGPAIATGLDPTGLTLETRLNGEVRQRIETSDLLFSVARLVAYMSEAITLPPGAVILTGTPAGIGPVQPGDVVEIEIGGVGVLRNPVVAEEDLASATRG